MSDYHHYALGLYEAQQAFDEAQIKAKAMLIADAAMAAIDDRMSLQGMDWEQLHQQISNKVNDVLLEKGQ